MRGPMHSLQCRQSCTCLGMRLRMSKQLLHGARLKTKTSLSTTKAMRETDFLSTGGPLRSHPAIQLLHCLTVCRTTAQLKHKHKDIHMCMFVH